MKKLVLLAAALLATTSFAVASDLPSRAAAQAPAPYAAAPIFTWTGLYVGVNGGYSFGKDTTDLGISDFSKKGANVGGTVGVNYQVARIVLGLEGDLNWSNAKATQTFGSVSVEDRLNYFGTARGRVGYAFGDLLPYVTGGLYWQGNKATVSAPGGSLSATDTSVGWTVGAGAEYALSNNWSVKGEYLYANTGKQNYGFPVMGPLTLGTQAKGHENIVRAGLNYKF